MLPYEGIGVTLFISAIGAPPLASVVLAGRNRSVTSGGEEDEVLRVDVALAHLPDYS